MLCVCKYAAHTEFHTNCHTLSLHDSLPTSRSPSTPRTRSEGSTTEVASGPIRQVPQIWNDVPPNWTALARMSSSVSMRDPGSVSSTIQSLRASCLPKARSEEHTSELQSLMRISYAVFCLKKKTPQTT